MKNNKPKIAFVIQRYGLEVNGGAEFLCRKIAEHLSDSFQIEILTTCSKDFITWKNEYNEGLEKINNISVRRFKVDKTRNMNKLNEFSRKIIEYEKNHKFQDEIKWMEMQGPLSPKLMDYIKKNKENYDLFIFITYLYYHAYFGLQIAPEKSIFIPTAHDEPPIYLKLFYGIFNSPAAFIYLTKEEKDFIHKRFKNKKIPNDTIGIGIDVINANINFREKYKINTPYILFFGRIDSVKCENLFNYFINYKNEYNSDLKLVLMGKPTMNLPKHKDIIYIGFVSEEDKFAGIKQSDLVISPCRHESLSISTLEAWGCKKPVLVNGKSTVLKAHCIKSNGGLYYENYSEFRECLDLLLKNPEIRVKMGINGNKYIKENYNWNSVIAKYKNIINKTISSSLNGKSPN